MEVQLPERGLLQVSGGIERGVSWALQFLSAPRIAPGPPPGTGKTPGQGTPRQARLAPGAGRAAQRPDRWRVFRRNPAWRSAAPSPASASRTGFPGRSAGGAAQASRRHDLIRKIDIEADRFAILGRVFPDARIDARRDPATSGGWRSAARLRRARSPCPLSPADDAPIVLDMERLWLRRGGPGRR